MNNDIFNKKKNLRDYDKEPIIINNYEMPFVMLSDILSLSLALVIVLSLDALITKNEIADFLFVSAFIVVFSLIFIIFEFAEYLKNKEKIILKNKTAEFYKKSKLVHITQMQNLDKIICKLSSCYSSRDRKYRNLIPIGILIFTIIIAIFSDFYVMFLCFTFLISIVFSNFIMKFLFCVSVIKKSDRYFSVFPIIVIGKSPKKSIQQIPLYSSLIVFSKKEYSEIKEYFLNLHNINIDNVEKIYF